MSELPALRDALVGAAARRVRRRRRRTVAAVGWIAVAAAVAVVALLARSEPRDRERPAAPPPGGALEQAFPIFARPARAGDAVPPALLRGAGALGGPLDLNGRRSRLAIDDGGERIWLVAGERRGYDWLCIVRSRRDATPPVLCGVLADVVRLGMSSSAPQVGRRPGSLLEALPAGARDVRLTLVGGQVLSPPLRNGVAIAAFMRKPASSGWTDSAGIRHIARMVPAAPRRPSGCPVLGALPADAEAQARRTALLAVDNLYPAAVQATVTSVAPVAPGVCTRPVTDRSLAVSLRFDPIPRPKAVSEGRLLVGMVDGRMAVWRLQR